MKTVDMHMVFKITNLILWTSLFLDFVTGWLIINNSGGSDSFIELFNFAWIFSILLFVAFRGFGWINYNYWWAIVIYIVFYIVGLVFCGTLYAIFRG